MGLDMYLSRVTLHGYSLDEARLVDNYLNWQSYMKKPDAQQCSFKEWCNGDESAITDEMLAAFQPDFTTKYAAWDTEHKYGRVRLFESVGYWRKENHIHRWFVENVQNGEDDCGSYIVTPEQLQELRDVCQQVLNVANVERGAVAIGQTCTNGTWKTMAREGDVVTNPDACAELLPTQGGFFFGQTDYDEYYLCGCQDTIDIIDNVLATTDFDTQTIVYNASW